MFTFDGKSFELVKEHRECFNEEQFKERYTDILDKYDVIVGDISSEILRLRGFSSKSQQDTRHVSKIPDYLNESCSFNCAYFILRRIKTKNKISKEK